MVSLPTYDPNKLRQPRLQGRQRLRRPAERATRPSRCSTARCRPRCRRGRRSRSSPRRPRSRTASTPRRRWCPAGSMPTRLPQSSNVVHNDVIGACGSATARSRSCRRCSSPATPPSPRWRSRSAPPTCTQQAEGYGFNQHYLDTDQLPYQAISRYPADLDPAADRASSGFGQGSVTATPLQMAMIAAGIANNGVVMKPYLVEELESPSQQPLAPTHAPRAQPGDLRGRRPTRSPS